MSVRPYGHLGVGTTLAPDEAKNISEELVGRVRSGDRAAFDSIFRQHYAELCDFVRSYVRAPEIAEELVQDVFLNIWRIRHAWCPHSCIKSYLYRAARNRSLDYLKRKVVERAYVDSVAFAEDHFTPADALDLAELSQMVTQAIAQLPESRREIFLMNRREGLSYAQIAERLNISVKTVETQIGRSLKSLREVLSDYLP